MLLVYIRTYLKIDLKNEVLKNEKWKNIADFTADSTSGIRKEYNGEVAKDNMSSGLKNDMTAQGISGRSASILLTYANPVRIY